MHVIQQPCRRNLTAIGFKHLSLGYHKLDGPKRNAIPVYKSLWRLANFTALGLVSSAGIQSALSPYVVQDRHTLRALEELDLSACLGQEGVDEPMTQEQFLAQTPARCRMPPSKPREEVSTSCSSKSLAIRRIPLVLYCCKLLQGAKSTDNAAINAACRALDPALKHIHTACRRLRLEHMRLSPLKSPVSVTLVTTYDISRLHMLEGLCSSWGGHLSAAVYQVSHGGTV